ncbi:F-box/FBD/LRR-repeat protein At5g22700-like [Phragmites australis]|uniref:F-box/FBD/LRR-repeat protein At5g22700-like n=1 Tax=Phragmites australis TaxID=29695 RepID=UPI002D772124|nr:F-box/FBD/LRR-repeat protein At5g22700-like [Phragmites australis]
MPLKVISGCRSTERVNHLAGSGEEELTPRVDRLSALSDALLHHIMLFMEVWEVVRMCVLSQRWRDLWASAPCIDVRVRRYSDAPRDFAKFVHCLLLIGEVLALVDTLRRRSPSEDDEDFDDDDVKMWICNAIKRKARVIQLNGHLNL